eukprot:1636892-Amphidinium_carterae.1
MSVYTIHHAKTAGAIIPQTAYLLQNPQNLSTPTCRMTAPPRRHSIPTTLIVLHRTSIGRDDAVERDPCSVPPLIVKRHILDNEALV